MMVGYMQKSALRIIFVSAHKIVLAGNCHVRSRYWNIFVTRNVYTSRIIDLIISTRSNWETRHIALTMIKYCIHIGWKNGLIIVVHHYRRVCPPEESLREWCTII